MPDKLKLFISAGEHSGDIHSSALIKELKNISEKEIDIQGLGGDNLRNEGVDLLYHTKDLATIGLWDVAKKYRYFNNILKECFKKIRETDPDCIILVDYPGFNLKLAEEARKFYKGKIIYYIAPQVWAWNSGRVKKMKKYLDKILVVFPFEVEFYKRFGLETEYTGHPLVRRINNFLNENKKEIKTQKVITILPGSRITEINHHMPELLETARIFKNKFNAVVNFSRARSLPENAFRKFQNEMNDFDLTGDDPYKLILNSDVVLAKAGTSTVECALLNTPCLIFYRTNLLNYRLLKPFVKVNNLGMVNILAGRDIVKEFIQKDFTKEKLAKETEKLLFDKNYRNNMLSEFDNIRKILGKKDSAVNAANLILKNIYQ